MSNSTYKIAKARESSASNPDNIYYDKNAAFRDQDYRQLFHQDGTIGTFSVRLLEAADLTRRHWSALALGPMKHLGLSKAHGGVSSCVSFRLDTTASSNIKSAAMNDMERKIPARNSFKNELHELSEFVSPVVPNDNNPVWADCQFEIPLKKGALQDGQPVHIALRVDEDSTAIENIIPGIGSSGPGARLLGVGHLNVTSLCLGQNPATARPTTGVIDTWIPIRVPDELNEDDPFAQGTFDGELLLEKEVDCSDLKKIPSSSMNKAETKSFSKTGGGRVRVLITYTPHGLKPERNDIVALEAFARQDSRTATCQSILPPMIPMQVVKISEPWLLVKYRIPSERDIDSFNDYQNNLSSQQNDDETGYMRLHRNAVFVIERKNLVDGALNLALQPAEFLLSTPLGKGVCELLGPAFAASKQLLMPALLSSKLVWMAVRATALAGFTGVSAAGSAFVNEGASSLTKDTKRRSDEIRKVRYV